jgi:hypothetical protein
LANLPLRLILVCPKHILGHGDRIVLETISIDPFAMRVPDLFVIWTIASMAPLCESPGRRVVLKPHASPSWVTAMRLL